MIEDGVTGMVLPGDRCARLWASTIDLPSSDEPRRQRMADAPHTSVRYSLGRTFEDFWSEHVAAARATASSAAGAIPRTPSRRRLPTRLLDRRARYISSARLTAVLAWTTR